MRKMFIITIFLLSFSGFAKAQAAPNYLFLEVIDSQGNPIKDANVQMAGHYWEISDLNNQLKEIWSRETKTDKDGIARNYWEYYGYGLGRAIFRVIKPEYYPFYDFGISKLDRNVLNAKIELLKIPTSDKERQLLGNEQLKREFLRATSLGDIETVRKLLKSGISPNLNTDDLRGVSGPKNTPAILFAAASGNSEMLKTFLDARVNIRKNKTALSGILAIYLDANPKERYDRRNKEQINKIMDEVKNGTEILINAGAEINSVNQLNETALMIAIKNGYPKTASLLIKKGASLNSISVYSWTPLMYAIKTNSNPEARLDIINQILKAGADPNIATNDNGGYYYDCRTALIYAVLDSDIDVVKLLIANKSTNLNITCRDGNTALSYAKKVNSLENPNKTQEIIKLLKEAGAK